MTESHENDRLDHLLSILVDGTLSPTEADELTERMRTDPAARQTYIAWMTLDARLRVRHAAPVSIPGLSFPSPPILHSNLDTPPSPFRNFSRSLREVVWHPVALLVIVGFLSAGMLAYVFTRRPVEQPLVQRPTPGATVEPAAKIVRTTDAQWQRNVGPDGVSLTPGQHLVLHRGSAEIVFGKQARVIIEGPADFVITDAAACRLDGGTLTAHVPSAAKGFQVHTPDGTVTDLGTEFGVYVKTAPELEEQVGEQEQPATGGLPQVGKQAPFTEVHVFKGEVKITGVDQLSQPPSPIANRTSTILSAGQAVTICENKVQPLAAADPFKFALNKLQGKPGKVLLSDDFETYELGHQVQAIGPWIVQSGTRKGQGVSVIDPVQRIAQSNAEGFTPIAPSPSLVGRRVAYIGASAPNPPDTFPLLVREIDGRLLTQNCQVLLEFDVFLHGVGFQHSLALATEIGHTEGIELWRGIDAAKKVDVAGLNWYRLRVLLDVANGVPRDVRVDRSHWRGPDGWVRDLSFQPPLPKLDWSTPPRYVIFGYPVVTPSTPAGVLWVDNIRMEVITDK